MWWGIRWTQEIFHIHEQVVYLYVVDVSAGHLMTGFLPRHGFRCQQWLARIARDMVSDASRRHRKEVAALSLGTIMGSSFKLFPVPMLDLFIFLLSLQHCTRETIGSWEGQRPLW